MVQLNAFGEPHGMCTSTF